MLFFLFKFGHNKRILMKNIVGILLSSILVFSCTKKASENAHSKSNQEMVTDSINAARTKINDSIKILNDKNRFKDFSGEHQISHNLINNKGSIVFKKIGRDEYDIPGEVKSGKDQIKIAGTGILVSKKHLNFTGTITQNIAQNDNGKSYTRKGTKTFLSKDGGKTWRLQDMVNSSGFIDYIDITF